MNSKSPKVRISSIVTSPTSYNQVGQAAVRADQVRDRLDGRLNEFKVSEGEDLLNCDLSILVLVGSLNKVLQQVAHQCQLLVEKHFDGKLVIPGNFELIEELENLVNVNFVVGVVGVDEGEQLAQEVQGFGFG